MRERFWEQPIETLNREEWEALCDGCGKCCLHKLEDEETGELHPTNVACRLLDRTSCRCSNYKLRRRLRARLRAAGRRAASPRSTGCPRPAPTACAPRASRSPDWHYLVSGDRETVHEAGMSVRGWTISEDEAGDLEHHLVDREL